MTLAPAPVAVPAPAARLSPPRDRADVVVIGGGAVGLATAMALARDGGASVVVVEAEERVARHQTGNNSGVIHSGLYYKPGSYKARFCAAGRDAMYAFCREHGIAHDPCGKVVVATSEAEIPALDELARRGTANGLADLRRLSGDALREYEPHVAGVAGLHVKETGIVDYKQVASKYADLVRDAGGEVRLGTAFRGVRTDGNELVVRTTGGEVRARSLINCGGLHSDRVARTCGLDPGVRIVPFRGEYYELTPAKASLVRNLIYPVPDARFPFLGVHFTRMIGGGVEAGPNAVLAFARHGYKRTSFHPRDAAGTALYGGFWRMARKFWRTGMGEMYRSFSKGAFLRSLQRLIPELTAADIVPGGAGVRAQALTPDGALVDDFRVLRQNRMVHVLNAPSPAATASIAIGRHIAGLAAEDLGLTLRGEAPLATT
ncbi:MAG: L-2-hydroxyglutarate oxidase [Phycisphaerales bacterium]|nr:L-2-hydroxyglutarate oxidase [Phycisphaerales bacterium]